MDTDSKNIAMFPLNILLLPGEQIPLHIFEPRFQQLFDEVEKSKFTKEKIIIELKNLAISHLQKEDQQLYPSLLNSEKEEIRGIASIFSNMLNH